MAARQQSAVIRLIHKIADSQREQHDSDRDLLRRFVEKRDEDAFAVLLRRHASMVMGVALRVLHHYQDAEDVCQATFLLLAKKAKGTVWRDSVANWLYRIAYQMALKARRTASRRSAREGKIEPQVPPDPLTEISVRDLQNVLDEELGRLAGKYRAPLILCCLEGKSRDEAARFLGLPLSTLISRLEKGRELLRRRLAGRGIPLSLAVAGVTLFSEAGRAAVPATVLETIRRTAIHAGFGKLTTKVVSAKVLDLLRGGMQMLLLGKLKVTAVGLVVAGLLTLLLGESLVRARQAIEEGTQPPQKAQVRQVPAKKKTVRTASPGQRLQGTWLVDSATVNGMDPKKSPGIDYGPITPGSRWVFSGDKVNLQTLLRQAEELRYRLDPRKDPRTIDLIRGKESMPGIYRLEGDTLTLCFSRPGKERPKTFQSERKSGLSLLTLKRAVTKKAGAVTKEALKLAKKRQDNHLSRILLAFRNYEGEHGHLPAAAICDKDGKPLLSWRVAILKHLGHENLLNAFHLDEPWDSAHNKKLLARMPSVYLPLQPNAKKPYTTSWQVFVGKGTPFEGTKGMPLKDIRKGKDFGKVILCAEGAEPVLWTKPDDLVYAANKPLPKLGGHYPTGFFIGMLDGSTCFVKARFNDQILRLAISRTDDGAFDLDDLRP